MTRGAPLQLRQLLAGRDFARDDPLAAQMRNYVYAVVDPGTGTALLVDPAWAPDELARLLGAEGYRLTGAVLTHYHADHAGGGLGDRAVRGVAELLEVADVPVHVQRDELAWLARSTGLAPGSFVAHDPGDEVAVGSSSVTLLHTPGHTPGSQCVLLEGMILTGDTLFLDGCGRTDLPGGDPAALHETLARKLSPVPDATLVFPGHAYAPRPNAAMGQLRMTNPVLAPLGEAEWLARFAS